MDDSTWSSVGRRIREARTSRGLTQRDLGDAVGVTHVSISTVERGEARPTFDLLQTLLDRFDVNINWLVSGKGPPRASQLVAAPPRAPIDDNAISGRAVAAAGSELPPGMAYAQMVAELQPGGALHKKIADARGAPESSRPPPLAPAPQRPPPTQAQRVGYLASAISQKLSLLERALGVDDTGLHGLSSRLGALLRSQDLEGLRHLNELCTQYGSDHGGFDRMVIDISAEPPQPAVRLLGHGEGSGDADG